MAHPDNTLKWSALLVVGPTNNRLVGDKITLPQSALEALLAAAPKVYDNVANHRALTDNFGGFAPFPPVDHEIQSQLPNPLTFRLVNSENGKTVYAGIREFSADEGEVQLSAFLKVALGLEERKATPAQSSWLDGGVENDVKMVDGDDRKEHPMIRIYAHQLPKGNYVRLRPLEAGYDPDDWKSLLERYMRDNYTTLTVNEVLDIKGARNERFRFLVDKFEPEGEGICIIDTDLEVDIEALDEEQARETLQQRLSKAKNGGSSSGGTLEVPASRRGQVVAGAYVDYEIHTWDRTKDLELYIETDKDEPLAADILVTPMSSRQRTKPYLEDFVFAVLGNGNKKRLVLPHTNVEIESADWIAVSVHVWTPAKRDDPDVVPFTLLASSAGDPRAESAQGDTEELSADETICKNCQQRVPKRSLPLHEAFCYRNNVVCPKCSNVFLKTSDAWKAHWHCPHDSVFANSESAKAKHNALFHPPQPLRCSDCDFEAYDIAVLAQHRTSTCPAKTILCQFCHLEVPQQGPDDPLFNDAEVLLSGLTPHEVADGARTTECHLCSRIVRLRDMKLHLGLHDRERMAKPEPRICRNDMCSRTIASADEMRVLKEQMGLCAHCFGPLYSGAYDPEGKQLRRRVERRLLQQLTGGCGKSWCQNEPWCRTAHKNVSGDDRVYSIKDALPIVKPVLDGIASQHTDAASALAFCVDEAQQSRTMAVKVLSQGSDYAPGWVARAIEETKSPFDADQWLRDRAPRIGEKIQ
jgi:hypothetical protein